MMIKGVNKKVVEVSETQCEYFERIMFFVSPEYAGVSEGKIRDRASMIANANSYVPPTKTAKHRAIEAVKLTVSALFGALIMLASVQVFG